MPVKIGDVYGRLTVIGPAEKRGRNTTSLCRCECGNEKVILNMNLLSESTRSCGCLARQTASALVKERPPRLKHGMKKSITYNCWQGMVSRCHNDKDDNYARYGAKGISVCARWRDETNGLANFVEDMGERPSKKHSIDRIDGKKGYEPDNCRWVLRHQQNQNVGLKKSNTLGYKGIARCRDDWKAEIRNDGAKLHLGVFSSKEEAALAYNVASEILHGEYGVRNMLPDLPETIVKCVRAVVTETLKKKTNIPNQG